jgi:3-oxoacyl-[acyl-carrier protein] reductase
MTGRLEGKTALITGGARGIGAVIAEAFVREGALVAIVDRELADAKIMADKLMAGGGTAVAIAANVSDETAVADAVQTAIQSIGRIDILINNAGISTTAPLVGMPTAMWDDMIAVNLRSVFLCTRAVLPGMIERKFGRVISISSQLAQKGAAEMAHYTAAKAGIIGFTRSLAYEVARDGITVNAICPGPIDTELSRGIPEARRARKIASLPIGRFGLAEEIAPTAVLLASDEGSYYIGATLNPNGGDIMV